MDNQSPPEKKRFVWWLLMAGTLASLAFLWLTKIPLGIPGEWTWDRATPESDGLWNLVGGAIAAALGVAYVVLGWQRLDASSPRPASRLETAAWLMGLVVVAFAWLWIVEEISPAKNRLGKAPFVLYYPSSSGYFTRARYDERDVSEFLTNYEDLMRQGDVLHTGTHPPGLFLVFYGLNVVCKSPSSLTAFLDATQSSSFREACDVIESISLRSARPRELLPQDRCVLWLATLLVMFCAACTVVPLFGLLLRNVSVSTAWICAAFWPAIPAVAIFVPKSDVVFPLVATGFMLVWRTAWDRRSVVLALLAGIIAWCGMICSLAFLPVFLATAILSLGSAWSESTMLDRRAVFDAKRIACIAASLIGFVLLTFALGKSARINLLNVWWLNYQNHAGFYHQFTRTYWKWLLVNPIELMLAIGFPVALLALKSCFKGFWFARSGERTLRGRQRILTVTSLAVVWGLLWLTGKNSGEAARLWVIFMPWSIWLASLPIDELQAETESFTSRRRQVIALLALQYASSLLTVTHVSGFHGELN